MKLPLTAVMVIPTGIGATIGGHAGDATLAAHLLAGAVDTLILHLNVVNAADFIEMPNNALYVEGSMLDRFLRGEIYLRPVRENKVLVVANEDRPETQNAISTARLLLGMRIDFMILDTPLVMKSEVTEYDGAGGTVTGLEEMCRQVASEGFDALAVHSPVDVDQEVALNYMRTLSTVNPWGGVEAILSKRASAELGRPVAHAPVETNPTFNEVVPEPIAPELVSISMLYSVLKGLHRAPLIAWDGTGGAISVDDVDVLVSPDCWGPPHDACVASDVPVIRVVSNKTLTPATGIKVPERLVRDVGNYLEAAGVLVAMGQGLSLLQRF